MTLHLRSQTAGPSGTVVAQERVETWDPRRTAIIGMAVGTLCMTVFGSLFNALYLIPKFAELTQESPSIRKAALVVDIRTPEEWAETGVLPGVSRLTYADPESFAAAFLAEYSAEIAAGREVILLCRSGRRSAAAAEALSSQISNRVVSLAGGMIALMEKGASTVAP